MVSPLRIYTRIFYRKVELRFLCRMAHKRIEEISDLTTIVGHAFHRRTTRFSAIGWNTLKDMGYVTDAQRNRINPLCWNAPIAITIYIDGEAYFGLGVEFRRDALCIRQMQGVHGKIPPQDLQDWPEIFIRACVEAAETLNFKEVRIYKANQDVNFYVPIIKPQEGQSFEDADRLHQDRMRRRYDRTAQKLKFIKKKRYYVWKVVP